jgi:CRISPR system Cascade subunit CasA
MGGHVFNLLTDPLFTVNLVDGGQHRVSLPELFALLEEDRVAGFPRLLPHQRHAWHAFLVQVACLVLENESLPALREGSCLLGLHGAAWWAGALHRLTPGFARDEPWTLVVEDLAKPAFLQPPATDGPLKNWKGSKESPDELDVLVTSKNHGVKQVRMNAPEAEDWLFALVSAQTQGAYRKGSYGIARQNKGIGTRAGFSLVSGSTPGGQWARDARVILENLNTLAPAIFTNPRRALLWLEPWDGRTSWPLADLHPLFVEICRRIRLTMRGQNLRASYKATTCSRVAAEAFKGNVGDPWIPIEKTENKAYGSSLSYHHLSLLLGNAGYDPSLLMKAAPCDPSAGTALQCRILLRGQGKTNGYHERIIPIYDYQAAALDSTGKLAKRMVDLAGTAETKVLKPALHCFLQGGARNQSGGGKKRSAKGVDGTSARVQAMDRDVDDIFFPKLWEILEKQKNAENGDDAMQIWIDELRHLVKRHFKAALSVLSGTTVSLIRAQTEAELLFGELCSKELPPATQKQREEQA